MTCGAAKKVIVCWSWCYSSIKCTNVDRHPYFNSLNCTVQRFIGLLFFFNLFLLLFFFFWGKFRGHCVCDACWIELWIWNMKWCKVLGGWNVNLRVGQIICLKPLNMKSIRDRVLDMNMSNKWIMSISSNVFKTRGW